jgi:hypothetical protein
MYGNARAWGGKSRDMKSRDIKIEENRETHYRYCQDRRGCINSGHVELNPARAKLAGIPAEWRWSSARAHLPGRDDGLVKVAPLLAMVADWNGLLDSALREEELKELRGHVSTGRPLGDETFLDRLEGLVRRVLKPQKGGRPKKTKKLASCPLIRTTNEFAALLRRYYS